MFEKKSKNLGWLDEKFSYLKIILKIFRKYLAPPSDRKFKKSVHPKTVTSPFIKDTFNLKETYKTLKKVKYYQHYHKFLWDNNHFIRHGS